MRVNDKGWLEAEEGDQPLHHVPSVRYSKLCMKKPKAVVWHWTATVSATPKELTESVREYDGEKDRADSWHVLIGRDGSVWQSVSFLHSSWHVRRGGMIGPGYYQNLNKATVGITLENAGRLKREEDGGWYQRSPKNVQGECVEGTKVSHFKGSNYENYTAEQVSSAKAVLKAIASKYEMPRKHCVYGHSTFEYPRAEDPGPLWSEWHLPSVLDGVFTEG